MIWFWIGLCALEAIVAAKLIILNRRLLKQNVSLVEKLAELVVQSMKMENEATRQVEQMADETQKARRGLTKQSNN